MKTTDLRCEEGNLVNWFSTASISNEVSLVEISGTIGNSKIREDLVLSQEQMLLRCESLVDCDTKNKVLTLRFSGILKLGAQILPVLSRRGYLWNLEESVGSGIQWKY